MTLRDKVLYYGRLCYVVGIRYPRRGEHGCFLDLCRNPQSARADYRDVPESRVRPANINNMKEN